MNRKEKHVISEELVKEQLRKIGLTFTDMHCRSGGADLLVEERIRIAVRVAFPGKQERHVYYKERVYTYDDEKWQFNFHQHGKWNSRKRYCEIFWCLAMNYPEKPQVSHYIIPSSAVTGATFSIHRGRKLYFGQYAKYMDWFDTVPRLLRETPKRTAA